MIWSVQMIENKRKLNWITFLIPQTSLILNFSIIQIEIVAIQLFLVTGFVSWDNWIFKKLETWQIYYSHLTIMKNAVLVTISIQNLNFFVKLKFKHSIIWIIQLFDVIHKIKCELKLKLSMGNWMRFLNSVLWIDFVKKNCIR